MRNPIYIGFNTDGADGSGSGGNKEIVTVAISEYNTLRAEAARTAELLKQSEENGKKITELEQALDNLEAQKEDYKARFEGLEGSVRADYLEKLPEEHRPIAKLITTVEGLAEYVKLNSQKPAGSDSAKPGFTGKEFLNAKWDELSYNEKEEIRKKRPEFWRKIYKEKFGHNP